jgi:uncharacterized RDD family membrane protein YckC
LFGDESRNVVRGVVCPNFLLPAFLLADAVLVQATERDQRVGDLAAETVVVREGEAPLAL